MAHAFRKIAKLGIKESATNKKASMQEAFFYFLIALIGTEGLLNLNKFNPVFLSNSL